MPSPCPLNQITFSAVLLPKQQRVTGVCRAPGNMALLWHVSRASFPTCLAATLVSISSIRGGGTLVAPAMLAQCIGFVTKISVCANNGGHQEQLPCRGSLFQYNVFPCWWAELNRKMAVSMQWMREFLYLSLWPHLIHHRNWKKPEECCLFFNETISSGLVWTKVTLSTLKTTLKKSPKPWVQILDVLFTYFSHCYWVRTSTSGSSSVKQEQ